MSLHKPIIIIGAGRSGTNMLRDTLTKISGVGTWPCDEINYIWRHGNIRYETDELNAEHATAPICRFVQQAFMRVAAHQNVEMVVEKTCANSLRVPFVDAILPNAKYIFIVRDGRDVVASALKRWSAPMDVPYILRKARYVPFADLPYYAVQYLGNQLYRFNSNEQRLAFWGPKFLGMDEMLASHTLAEVCAAQWSRCVQRSEDGFAHISPERVHRIRYEDFVCSPKNELEKVSDFLEIENGSDEINSLAKHISPSSIGKWKKELSAETLSSLEPLVQSLLKRYNYINSVVHDSTEN